MKWMKELRLFKEETNKPLCNVVNETLIMPHDFRLGAAVLVFHQSWAKINEQIKDFFSPTSVSHQAVYPLVSTVLVPVFLFHLNSLCPGFAGSTSSVAGFFRFSTAKCLAKIPKKLPMIERIPFGRLLFGGCKLLSPAKINDHPTRTRLWEVLPWVSRSLSTAWYCWHAFLTSPKWQSRTQ